MNALFSDPDVMRFVGDGRPVPAGERPGTIERILAKYRADTSFFIWAVEEAGDYAGHAELKRRSGRTEYELVYILQRRRWGRGLGATVVDLLLNEAIRRDVPFVIATVATANYASAAILRSRGFESDGTLSGELGVPAFRRVLKTQ